MKKTLFVLFLTSIATLPMQAVGISFTGTAGVTADGVTKTRNGPVLGSYHDAQTGTAADGLNQIAQGSFSGGPLSLIKSNASQAIAVTDSGFTIDAKTYAYANTYETSAVSKSTATTSLDATFYLESLTTISLTFDIYAGVDFGLPDEALTKNLLFSLEAQGGGTSIDLHDFTFSSGWGTYSGVPYNSAGDLTGVYTTTLGPGTYHLVHNVMTGDVTDFMVSTFDSKLTVNLTPSSGARVPEAGSLLSALAAALGIFGVAARRMRR